MSAVEQKVNRPVILVGQPELFVVAGSQEKLLDWEKRAVERFGLSPQLAKGLVDLTAAVGGTCCDSGGGGDCDVDGAETA